jgi:crossover junction endodeoxyribonuclease RuvC
VCEHHGLIQTPRIDLPSRLHLLHTEFQQLLETLKPDVVATERLIFAANKTTALDVSKALGVVLQTVGERNLVWKEFLPSEIKLGVVGNGAADKRQVEFMVVKLLGFEKPPKPDDITDALAIAICAALRPR